MTTAVLAAFFSEYLYAAAFGPRVPVPPLALIATAWWLPMFPLSWRLWIGGTVGMLMDTFGAGPFGVSILVMLIAALLTELFRSIIAARNGGIGHISIALALLVSALLLMPIGEAAIGYAQRLLL
ncbi:MAG: hypothetical protein AAB916_02080 [Patescibacteria group bacterium]